MSCPFVQEQSNTNPARSRELAPSDTSDPAIVHYHTYLHLDEILTSQHLESERKGNKVHDEHFFIITHQVYELWFKAILYELDSVCDLLDQTPFDERKLLVINQRMGRIMGILKLLVEQIHVLETMTPMDFLDFREYLAPASGFQSQQFRVLENRLGMRPVWRLKSVQKHYENEHRGKALDEIKQAEVDPSLLQILEKWLESTPGLEGSDFNFSEKFQDAVQKMLGDILQRAEDAETEDDKNKLMQEYESTKENFKGITDTEMHDRLVKSGDRKISHKALQGALFIFMYRVEPRISQRYQFLAYLMDLDALMMKWRQDHMQLVQRMIGDKPGTAGTSGYMYLKATCSERYKVFVDLFNLSTFLLPRQYIPVLTSDQ